MATTPTDNPTNADIGAAAVDAERDGPREWFLSSDELAATRAKIAKLNRRATRKGFTGNVAVHAEPAVTSYLPAPGALPVTVHGFTVTITGQPPAYDGWRFVAAVDQVPATAPVVTRSFAADQPPYFYEARHLVLGTDGTQWLSTVLDAEAPQLQPGEDLLFGVFEIDPSGAHQILGQHQSPGSARHQVADLTAHYAATGQPRSGPPATPAVVLRYPPGAQISIDNDTIRPGECDHCHTNRPRSTTIVVQHQDSGEIKQVGRSCLKDFLGHSTLPVFIDTDQVADEIDQVQGGQAAADWDLTSVLAYAWAVVETHGWTPASAPSSTRDLVAEALGNGRRSHEVLGSIAPKLEQGRQLAPRIIADLTDGLTGTSGYEANLTAILRAGTVHRTKHLGLAVSAINAWQRLTAPQPTPVEETAPRPPVRHAGSIGEKITVVGTISTAITVDGYHYNSPPQRLLVLDAGETVAKMVTAAAWAHQVKPGDQVTISGVVKAHTDYNGTPQTVLKRPQRLPGPTHAPDATGPSPDATAPSPDATEAPGPVLPLWETVKPVSPSRFQEAALAAAAPTPTPGLAI